MVDILVHKLIDGNNALVVSEMLVQTHVYVELNLSFLPFSLVWVGMSGRNLVVLLKGTLLSLILTSTAIKQLEKIYYSSLVCYIFNY